MENTVKQNATALRTFKVGIVGASRDAFDALTRIFEVTKYRARRYLAVPLIANTRSVEDDIDLIILCTNNPNIIKHWNPARVSGKAMRHPLIRVSRQVDGNTTGYVITVPVNPGRLLRQLDQYTIKELNFFPEFQIGNDSTQLNAATVAGLKLLRSDDQRAQNKLQGLQRALVVDDSLAVRKQIELEFDMLNVEVDCVGNAEAALESAAKTAYDIIFMDVVMPGMDGYAACRRIKRTPLNRSTPVILLTSRSSSFDKIKGALAGCDTYLIKPINHNEFQSVVNKHFAKIGTVSKRAKTF